ncbi:hypothetical protein TRAPUB_12434 [Trametes pubescens]|uniref:Uncharacterized protein n=1 Tax=Trametes pubescens TaxID=154538 RepID=A0A1M2VTX9_TRAPU|nr:hypothetical protein TRAPUB_12434 [Trametes pubescens]
MSMGVQGTLNPSSESAEESDNGSGSGEESESHVDEPSGSVTDVRDGMEIDFITGSAYAARAQESLKQATKLQCPFPHLPPLLSPKDASEDAAHSAPAASSSKRQNVCQYVFSRAYDLRRHLRAEHSIASEREKADEWVRLQKAGTRTAVHRAL